MKKTADFMSPYIYWAIIDTHKSLRNRIYGNEYYSFTEELGKDEVLFRSLFTLIALEDRKRFLDLLGIDKDYIDITGLGIFCFTKISNLVLFKLQFHDVIVHSYEQS